VCHRLVRFQEVPFSIINVLFDFAFDKGEETLPLPCAPKNSPCPKILEVCAGQGDTSLNYPRFTDFFFNLSYNQHKKYNECPSCVYIPVLILSLREFSLKWEWYTPDNGPLKHKRTFEGGGVGNSGCFLLAENLLILILQQNHSALIFPHNEKELKHLGLSPPTTLSNNTASSMLLRRFTKEREQWLTHNYTGTANYPALIVILVSAISFLQ
jgi:hypothetical protein